MRFYIHPINPHHSAVSADHYFEGYAFGIWEHPYPALDATLYRFQSKHLEAAQHTRAQAEDATRDEPDQPVGKNWLALEADAEPHSMAAAALIQRAVKTNRPVRWPWTEQSAHRQ